jgi:hypothetical protein
VPGPVRTLEHGAERADRHGRREPVRIHLRDRGSEDAVDALGGGDGTVARLVARIAVEVLARAELGRVHEEAHHDLVALGARAAQEGAVAGMERAHGGDEAEAHRRSRTAAAELGLTSGSVARPRAR